MEVTEVSLEPSDHRLQMGLLLSLYEDDSCVSDVACVSKSSPQIISEARGVNDGEVRVREVTKEVSLVSTGLLGHGLCYRLHLNSA